MKNQRMAEYLIVAAIVAIGTPVALIWGVHDGEKLGLRAYGDAPRVEVAAAPQPAAEAASEDYRMFLSTSEAVARGKSLFQASCAACHGFEADGKGPAAMAFTPPPRSFTNPDERWTQGTEPHQVFRSTRDGVPGTGMAPFGASLSDADIWAITHYLTSLPGLEGRHTPVDEDRAREWAASGIP